MPLRVDVTPIIMTSPTLPFDALVELINRDWFAEDTQPNELVQFWKQYGVSPTNFFKAEGYWAPAPGVEPVAGAKYASPVENSWSAAEATAFTAQLLTVQSWLTSKGFRRSFPGTRQCRHCFDSLGGREYYWRGWKWPEHLSHYVSEHYIRPSAEFQTLIRHLHEALLPPPIELEKVA